MVSEMYLFYVFIQRITLLQMHIGINTIAIAILAPLCMKLYTYIVAYKYILMCSC